MTGTAVLEAPPGVEAPDLEAPDLEARRAANLARLFEASSVAVLGASDNRSKVGSRPITLLRKYGFAGRIYPINAKRDAIAGLRCYADLAALPEVPDVVVFAIPARDVPAAVADCAARGVAAVVVYTSGFGEIDEAGRAVEDELRRVARDSGMILCGPNCQGVANFHNGLVLNFTSALMGEPVPSGGIGLVTQSGLVGGLIVTDCLKRGLGIGYLASTGNEAGMTLADAIGHMARDPRVRVIAGYVEQVRDMAGFRRSVEEARRNGKPVVLLKVGRSPDAARAAASHTGSLAGAAELYDAAFAAMGVVVVDSLEELIDLTMAFATVRHLPRGPRVGVLTNSGGLGVFSADEVFRQDLELAAFAPATVERIAARLLDFGSAGNPVDISTQAYTDIDAVAAHLGHIAADPAVDIVSVTFGLQFLNAEPLAGHLIRMAGAIDKPLLVSWISSDEAAAQRMQEAGVGIFSDPARALRAARRLADFGALAGTPVPVAKEGRDLRPGPLLAEALAAGVSEVGEARMLAALAEIGLPVPGMRRAAGPAEAAAAFAAMGCAAVVVKIDSPDIAHKSEVGGVRLDVRSAEEAGAVTAAMLDSVRTARPQARIDGVILAEMATGGVEAFIGVKRDPVLGPFVAVGLGGIFVEILKDVVLRPAPVTVAEAEAMIGRLKALPILTGARGRPPLDVRALAEAVATVSRLAAACPELTELDLNPVLVRERGVVVLDALASVGRPVEGQ
ncbi:acetate--CoA ligase family protein [Azospirillum doebereinerae]